MFINLKTNELTFRDKAQAELGKFNARRVTVFCGPDLSKLQDF